MNFEIHFLIFISLIFAEILYFRLAQKFNIIDKPNSRSLHSKLIIRGGGIIFPISVLFYSVFFENQFVYFTIGLILISTISFFDDIINLSNRYRIIIQVFSSFLLLMGLGFIERFGLFSILFLFLIVGVINAYNFMDGVNGITGGYSAVIFFTFFLINNFYLTFIDNNFLVLILYGIMIFNFLNFRKNAKCFAGDVGSISMAFIIIFILIKLILASNQFLFILFLAVYGIDTIMTILVRLYKKENIFKAHNQHLFQLLVRIKKFGHLKVTLIYMVIQLGLNFVIVFLHFYLKINLFIFGIVILVLLTLGYWIARLRIIELEKK